MVRDGDIHNGLIAGLLVVLGGQHIEVIPPLATAVTLGTHIKVGPVTVTSMDKVQHTIDGLSAIERPAVALVCLERFARHFGIDHPELSKFIEHLWGVIHVTPESWVAWANAFDAMVILKPEEEYPAEVARVIPQTLKRDFSILTRAVFGTSAEAWYCSNSEGTRDALLAVIGILTKRGVSVPDLTFFRLSPGNSGESWGPKPSDEIVASWRAMAVPNKTMEPTR